MLKVKYSSSDNLSVVIAPRRLKDTPPSCAAVASFELHGRQIGLALVRTKRPNFDRNSLEHRDKALLRIKAFSCNYRDRAFTLEVSDFVERNQGSRFIGVGSEFSAEVEQVGAGIRHLKTGDQVIADASYSDPRVANLPAGVPTNRASSRYLILHARKLMRVPNSMNPVIGASFTIGPQTSYSMIRKLELEKQQRVLVTAAHSNTSLFVLEALRKFNVDVFATTTAKRYTQELREIGVKRLFVLPRKRETLMWDEVSAFCRKHGEFDAVIDPFFDLHLSNVIQFIRASGRYISCGLYQQHEAMRRLSTEKDSVFGTAIYGAIIKNISIIGNCLGMTDDLKRAVYDHSHGRFAVKIDSTFEPHQMKEFFQRSFISPDRFGKVVMAYE